MTAVYPSSFLRSHPEIVPGLKSFAGLAARVGLLLAAYLLVLRWLSHTGHLPEASYGQPSLLVELGRGLLSRPLLPLAGLALLALRRRQAWRGWDELEYGRQLRIFAGLIALMCAWVFSTYDFNLYFNQAHLADRLILVLLAALVLWKPVFSLPFLLLLFTIIWQFDYPLAGQYPWTEMNLPVRVLAVVAAVFLLQTVTSWVRMAEALFLACCLIATFYWGSGIGKFQLDWISHRQLHLLLFGAYNTGWLNTLSPETIVTIDRWIAPLTTPMMVFTLLIEWGSLLFLLRRGLALALTGGFILFHLGVFAISGMLFWKWIVVEAALAALFLWRRGPGALPIFTRQHFVISLVLIGGGVYWFHPTNLSWYDTRLSYAFRYVGIGASGAEYPLPLTTFTPYADMMTLGNFAYLNPEPQLTAIYGITTDREVAERLVDLRRPEDILALERAYPIVPYHAGLSEQFDGFIWRFFANLNARGSKRPGLLTDAGVIADVPFSAFAAVPHIWSLPGTPAFTGQEPLRKVIVSQATWLYDGERFQEIRRKVVRTIEIPVSPP